MKHTIIRVLALLMALVLCCGLAACGNTPDSSDTDVKKSTTGKNTTTTTTVEDSSTADTTTTTEAPTTTTTTTVHTKNVVGGIGYVTTTTEAPTTTSAPKNPIRILSIGHSFSKDAMEAYLWDLLYAAGYDHIVLAYLFYPGCPLNGQWDRICGNTDPKTGQPYEYQQYRKTDPTTGYWSTMSKPEQYKNLAAYAIKDEQWDIITLQPSPDYGAGPEVCGESNNDYKNVGNIVNWINSNKTNPKAQLMYHMTWSFAEDCRLWSFMYSDYNQMQMYKDFVAATKKHIVSTGKFKTVIPAGTAIQNARSSRLGDVFNMPGNYDKDGDGYHLNDRGDYVAALTWCTVISGKSAKTAWCPDKYKDEFAILAEAVDNAVAKWDDVTESSYK